MPPRSVVPPQPAQPVRPQATAPSPQEPPSSEEPTPQRNPRFGRIRTLGERRRRKTQSVTEPAIKQKPAATVAPVMSASNKGAAVYQSVNPRPVSSLADRRKEITEERRRRMRRIAAIILVVAGLLIGAAYVVVGSSLLALDEENITITGAGGDTDQAAVEKVVHDLVSTPLVLLNPTEVAADISKVSGVKSVTVRREWPQGIAVEIIPREAVANVASEEGFAAVDEQGIALAALEKPREGLPIVEIPLDDPQTEPALHAVLSVLGSLPPELLELTAIGEAGHGQWVTLKLHNGAAVVWGTPDEGELKAAVLNTLLQIEAKEYDVSSPLAPVTR